MKLQITNYKLQTNSKFKILISKHVLNFMLGACYLFVIWCLLFGASYTFASVDLGNDFGYGYIKNLGQGTSLLVPATFSIATALVIIYFLVGAFKFLTSAGDKEAVAGARGMITHSIIGFIILMFAFLVFQFLLSSLFGITGLKIIQGS